MRVTRHLWLGSGGAPMQLVTYRLCEMYGCRPSELHEERLVDVLQHLTVRSTINYIQSLGNT